MQDRSTMPPPLSDGSGVTDAVRVQILATEHWSLLATRGATWNEMFARASMYLTVLSAATVALALVAQATSFGGGFRLFALLVLPVVLVLGVGTQIRLGDARGEDVWLVMGMNRLRHAYLELAPELEPYFMTARHDDIAGVMQTYMVEMLGTEGRGARVTPGRILASTPVLVGLINAAVAGVLAALVAGALGGATAMSVAAGIAAGLAYAVLLAAIPLREIARIQREWRPRFPGPGGQ
ncbi:MAG: hypothetical protein M3464_00180 [Chloroflexota bacterium]|nr:hypothetical protein [Chloroflexota bacterium]